MSCSVIGLRKSFQNNGDQNIDVWRRLGKTSEKRNLFTQTIVDKIYEAMSRNQAKLDRTTKL